MPHGVSNQTPVPISSPLFLQPIPHQEIAASFSQIPRLKHLESSLLPLHFQTTCRYSWLQTMSRNEQLLPPPPPLSLNHHSRLTTITSLLAHCNIRLTDLLFSFQPESSFKTIPDHVTPLLKSLQRIPILCSVKPKAFPRPQGPTGWTQCLSDLRPCRSPPHLPCSRGFSATPATLLPRGLCLPFPLPAPLLLLLSTWLTVGVGILKTEPIGCLDV